MSRSLQEPSNDPTGDTTRESASVHHERATSRRDFLRVGGTAIGALVIGIPSAMAQPLRRFDERGGAPDGDGDASRRLADTLSTGPYLRIAADGAITIVVARSEMGQGVRTSLPMILAEELGADYSRVSLVQASPSATLKALDTGGSESVSSMWQPLRKAGAAAREMFTLAAATRFGVEKEALVVASSRVTHPPSGRSATFVELFADAVKLPVPQDPLFSDPLHYSFIGKPRKRVDGDAIVRGSARYGIDVRLPGQLFATVAMPPVTGATVVSFNAAAAKAVSGVREIVQLPSGVAVVADNTWAAIKGRAALAVVWKDGANAAFDSTTFRASLRERVGRKGELTSRNVGDADDALAKAPAAMRVDATYEFPFQAHATMEPQNCTAHVKNGACEVWVGTQGPEDVQSTVAKALGLAVDKVTVHVTLLGGGFGRRITNENAPDAALLSQKMQAPVQVVWTRPDDFANDLYAPASVSQLSATIDAKKRISAWRHRIVAPAVTASFGGTVQIEAEALGAHDVPYAIPNIRVEYTHVPTPMRMGWWRAIEFVPNIFARESFIDELAVAAKMDALEFRLMLLDEQSQQDLRGGKNPSKFSVDRLRATLQMAALKAGWDVPLPKGFGRGIACLSYDDRSYVTQIAEVEVVRNRIRVRKLTTAIDVGTVINPLGITAQVESGVMWGITAALYGDMRFTRGRASRTSFGEYRVAGMTDAPTLVTHVMPPDFAPSGAGEPPVPAVAPAIANAVFNATGQRLRKLPLEMAALPRRS